MAQHALKLTNWYVIQVITGREERICSSIKQTLDPALFKYCFVPQRESLYKKEGKYISINKPLFPGYLFLITDHIEQVHSCICKMPHIIRILGTGNRFIPLEEKEVEVLCKFTDKAFNVSLSKGFIVGNEITITEGPLQGQEGRIRKIDRHKRIAIIEVSFLGKGTKVRVPLEIIEKRTS
jgi:transcriptional antiterminator NusG